MALLAPRSLDRKAAVLTKALLRAARALGLSQRDLAAIIGTSESSASRLNRRRRIDPASKEGELALLLLRVFRSLDALLGGDEAAARSWIQAHNRHLGATPLRRLRTVTGLVGVAEYLDAMRGKS
jgi:transcriptional regulator with XRE-family HTH domain